MKHKKIELTKQTFSKNLSNYGIYVDIDRETLREDLKKIIEDQETKSNELFISPFKIITRKLSNIETKVLKREIEKTNMFCFGTKNSKKNVKYICSDGGGHYSTDFYEFVEFCAIEIGDKAYS